jgi:hypothetical protein
MELNALMTIYDKDITVNRMSNEINRSIFVGNRKADLLIEDAEDEAMFTRKKANVLRVTGTNSALSIQAKASAQMMSDAGSLLTQASKIDWGNVGKIFSNG